MKTKNLWNLYTKKQAIFVATKSKFYINFFHQKTVQQNNRVCISKILNCKANAKRLNWTLIFVEKYKIKLQKTANKALQFVHKKE